MSKPPAKRRKIAPAKRPPMETVGWREHVDLPDLQQFGVVAKIDTGARTSSLHVEHIEPYTAEDGSLRAKLTLPGPGRKTRTGKRGGGLKLDVPLREFREVKSSNGQIEERAVIVTRMKLGTRTFEREFTLTNRRGMRYEILIGRTGLRRCFVVDPAKSFLLDPKPENPVT